ncbi:WhiB family transcriptional regulator [Streptomyces virginiae]|uniref:WhiB family transcriptional regulator n=1 Tax=Streptomyces virginiae TaxID=1961 RepID=UPI0035D648B7
MTSTQARRMRRPVLQAAIDAGARCTKADPDLFFRADGEPPATWQAQRAEAIGFCHGCPVRAACEELALRGTATATSASTTWSAAVVPATSWSPSASSRPSA